MTRIVTILLVVLLVCHFVASGWVWFLIDVAVLFGGLMLGVLLHMALGNKRGEKVTVTDALRFFGRRYIKELRDGFKEF